MCLCVLVCVRVCVCVRRRTWSSVPCHARVCQKLVPGAVILFNPEALIQHRKRMGGIGVDHMSAGSQHAWRHSIPLHVRVRMSELE